MRSKRLSQVRFRVRALIAKPSTPPRIIRRKTGQSASIRLSLSPCPLSDERCTQLLHAYRVRVDDKIVMRQEIEAMCSVTALACLRPPLPPLPSPYPLRRVRATHTHLDTHSISAPLFPSTLSASNFYPQGSRNNRLRANEHSGTRDRRY